jgi:hypothetical protein
MKGRDRRKARQEQAIVRQAVYDNLSPKQRLVLAMSRRGESKKEVKRLKKIIAKKEVKNGDSS